MKKISIQINERSTWVEEMHTVRLQGYEGADKKSLEKSIKDMLGWDENKAMEIKFYWCADNLCVVEFKYETREVR